jgi:hypothetical protein
MHHGGVRVAERDGVPASLVALGDVEDHEVEEGWLPAESGKGRAAFSVRSLAKQPVLSSHTPSPAAHSASLSKRSRNRQVANPVVDGCARQREALRELVNRELPISPKTARLLAEVGRIGSGCHVATIENGSDDVEIRLSYVRGVGPSRGAGTLMPCNGLERVAPARARTGNQTKAPAPRPRPPASTIGLRRDSTICGPSRRPRAAHESGPEPERRPRRPGPAARALPARRRVETAPADRREARLHRSTDDGGAAESSDSPASRSRSASSS